MTKREPREDRIGGRKRMFSRWPKGVSLSLFENGLAAVWDIAVGRLSISIHFSDL